MNKAALLLANSGQQKVRGWDIHVARLSGSNCYGYSNGSGFMEVSGGSFEAISSDTPTLSYLYTMTGAPIYGTLTFGSPNGLNVMRLDTGATIAMASSFPAIQQGFFNASDVGKTIRVVIVE